MLTLFLGCTLFIAADDQAAAAKAALAPFNELVGAWKASASPNVNNAAERRKGSWSETITWTWQLKGEPRLAIDFKDGKLFKAGVLRWRPAEKDFELTLTTPAGDMRLFRRTGRPADHSRRHG